MKRVTIVGSTGQIGTRALDVLRHLSGYRIYALVARSSATVIAQQAQEFKPERVVLLDEAAARSIGARNGQAELSEAIAGADVVLSAASGAAGLMSSVEAVKQGKVLALANKESIVMAGELLTGLAKQTGAKILPVDSEHSAIFQAIQAGRAHEIRRIIITASGGPLLRVQDLDSVMPEQALKHPVWPMGQKITIDSATLMNKALEVIEARWLFGVEPSRIEVLIHPQSIVHAIVEFVDGSSIAQMGVPDMRVPIQYALTYPDRLAANGIERLDLAKIKALTFEPPDLKRFPSLEFGRRAAAEGGTAGAALNAADEVAVDKFLKGKIKFTEIHRTIEHTMSAHRNVATSPTLDQILQADSWARQEAARFIETRR